MTMAHPLRLVVRIGSALAAAAVISLVLASPALAQASSVATAYQRAFGREQLARKSDKPPVKTLRTIATSYEAIVRRYPTSGYCDNALWQAAGLLQLAYDQYGATRDRDAAAKMLQWLKREYPASRYARQVDARVKTLATRGRPATTAASAPVKPSPPLDAPAAGSAAVPAPAPVNATPLPAVAEAISPLDVALRDVSSSALPTGERVSIELTREVTHVVQQGASDNQLVLNLPGVSATPAIVAAAARTRGALVREVRLSPASDGLVVRLDLTGHPHVSSFPLYDPYRIVIDLETEEAPAPAATAATVGPARLPVALAPPAYAGLRDAPVIPDTAPAPAPGADDVASRPLPPASTGAGGYSLARQLGLGVSRIVIDPGHGGHDPGAQANGVSEAELVLDVAKRLEVLLRDQPGVDVVLTRSTDAFVPLEERTAIANREQADLFLSIHANSSPQRDTRGVETYFLNFASNPRAEAVAARENASSVQAMGVLPQLVKAIALNNKLAESRELATQVQGSLVRRLSSQNKSLKDLGVKQAPFVVLIGAQMPSVLAEISFLTNKSDAALLKQGAYRQRIAQALCDAVLKYQASLKKVATVAARAEER
jgi:N-acetylmuramoyl-L-alanine amidase